MKTRRRLFSITFCLLLLIAVGGAWFLNSPQKTKKKNGAIDDKVEQIKQGTGSVELINNQKNSAQNKISNNLQFRLDRVEKLKIAISEKNVPINFWGKVVDQDGKPIQGARVTMKTRDWHISLLNVADSTFPKTETFTDVAGRFQLLDGSGDNLTVEKIEKEGYRLSPKAEKTFSFGQSPEPFFPDINNPVVVRMWKLLPAEPLKTFHFSKTIPYDGTAVGVNLVEGQLTEGNSPQSDLRITLERDPSVIAPINRSPFNWRATVTAVSGGLVVSDDEFMYLAPEEGYKERFEIDMPKTATDLDANQIHFFFHKRSEWAVLRPNHN